jgi:hypothetical protein
VPGRFAVVCRPAQSVRARRTENFSDRNSRPNGHTPPVAQLMHDVKSTLSDSQPVWCITHIPRLIARFPPQAFLQVAARSPRRRQNNKRLAARLAAMAKSPNFPRVYPNLLTATVYSSIGHERISRGGGGRVVAVPGAQCRVFVAHETIGGGRRREQWDSSRVAICRQPARCLVVSGRQKTQRR